MRRQVLLILTCLLALATGVALLRAGVMVAGPNAETGALGPTGDAAGANAALVRRFYDAVNTTVGTGDPTPLTEVVATDFADRAIRPGFAPTRDGLVQQLLTLRATFPAMWLVVEDLQPHGEWVLAHFRVEGVARGMILDVPFSGAPAVWVGFDVFRIGGNRIAERWSTGGWPVLPLALARASLAEPPAAAFVRLGRLAFAPGASQPRTALLGQLLVAVERGALTVRVEGEATVGRAASASASASPAAGTPPAGDILVGPGDTLMLSSGARYAIRNAGQTPAVALTLALFPWSAGASGEGRFLWPTAGLPDVTTQLLVEGVATDLPEGPVTIALGRVVLAPDAELAARGPRASRLVVVDAGILHLATGGGAVSVLSPGQGALVPPESGFSLRGDGDDPLVVLLATITPSAPTAGNPQPGG